MFELIEPVKGKVLALRLSGGITEKSQARLAHLVRDRARQWGRIRLLVVAGSYPSFNSAEDFYEDLRFARLEADRICKMAVIGDRAWKSTWLGLFGLFSGIKTEYFSMDQLDTAWKWVHAGSD